MIRLAALFALLAGPAMAQDRVLVLGGSVAEIVDALGQSDRLIARDTTTQYPPELTELPDVGYLRALSPEGVLSVDPDLILAEPDAGPPEALEVLRAAAIPYVEVPDGFDAHTLAAKIGAVGAALGVEAEAEALAAKTAASLGAAVAAAAEGPPARAIFVLSMANGRVMAAGTDTSADAMLRLAGAENVMADVEGYKPVSDEAIAAAAPDVVVMMDRGGDHGADDATLFAHPGFATSPAAEAGAVVRMDGLLLLGFGPRTPEAVERLASEIARTRGGG